MSYDTTTYVDGVPVKISEKYRPPRKVCLSSLCNFQVNTEVLTTEYDLTAELETLKWLQNLKNYKDNKVKIRKEKIKKFEEEKEEKRIIREKELEEEQKRNEERERIENEKKLEENKEAEEEKIVADDELVENEQEDNFDENSDKENKSNDITVNVDKLSHPSNNSINTSEVSCDTTLNYEQNVPVSMDDSNSLRNSQAIPSHFGTSHTAYYPMLVPTQCSPQTVHQKSPTKPGCVINFADFEGDSNDPFDSATLKSINDMEELAKVLQASSIKQQNANQFNYQQQGTYMNGGYSYPFSYVNYPSTNLPSSSTSPYNPGSSYQSKILPSPNTSVPSTGKPGLFQQDSFPTKNYLQWNSVNSSDPRPVNASQYKPYNYTVPNANNSNLGVPVDSAFKNIGTTYQNLPPNILATSPLPGGMQLASSGVESVGKRQDLEDFYTRYYLNKKSTSGARSGENTPNQMKGTLSSSSSVPDLTASEDLEVSNIIGNNLEKIGYTGSNNCTPTRPLSTGGCEVNRTTVQTPPEKFHKSRLPDPFAELNEEAQTLVQGIAEMGFPRPRVARAVQKLGTDHKKLLEVLLTLQSFQEHGEDEYQAERAFYFYMGEVSKVNEFLLAAKTLLDLGFEEENVVELLLKHGNDREKCLEELISL